MRKIYLILLFLVCVGYAQTGIGTTAPVNKLEVVTTKADPATTGVAANGNFRLGATVGTHVLDFGLSSSSTYSWLQARDKSNYGTNYNLVLNPNGGNLGIGTINPTSKLNLVGGGFRINNGFSYSTSRPAINTSTIGNYEIRGVGSGAGTTQSDSSDDGFLRLSAGGGTNSNTQSSIDISGYSNIADMNSNIVMKTAGIERLRIDNAGTTTFTGALFGSNLPSSTLSGFAANMNTQTGTTYTLLASDNGKIVTLNNASAVTVTVPSLFAGFNCMLIQLGAGQVTLTGSGTTITNRSGFTKSGGANAIVTLIAVNATTFISGGDMSN
jgi:hypothetical protein